MNQVPTWLAGAVAAAALASAPRPAAACATKHNEVAIVLGLAGDEVVTVRIALREVDTDDVGGSEWMGTATLEVVRGERVDRTVIGHLASAAAPEPELARLLRAARARAARLPGFTPAHLVATRDCTTRPRARCGDVAVERQGTQLRIGGRRVPLVVGLADVAPEHLVVTGFVTYRAGATEVTVANVGRGDPRFATTLDLCEDGRCRPITTLHHGAQTDVLVVGRGGGRRRR